MGFGDAWLGRGEKGGLNRGVGSVPARVSRRRPVRPSLAFFFCSAPTSEVPSHFVMAAVSFAGGRGFCFFFGGISPDSMRSWTFTQRAKLSASPKSGLSEVRSRSPFFVSALWHSAQCFSMKIRAGASAPKVDRPNIPMEKAMTIRAVIATKEMGMERNLPESTGAKHTKSDREARRFGGRGQRWLLSGCSRPRCQWEWKTGHFCQGRTVPHYPCSSITASPLAERGSAMTCGRMIVIGVWAPFDDEELPSAREGAASPRAR